MGWICGNVQMHIWPLEHCLDPIDRMSYGPHVTAVCGPENWTARIAFSMHYDRVYLHDIIPIGNGPKKSVVKRLLNDVYQKRLQCRAEWWKNMQSVCLDNAVVVKLVNGDIEILDTRNPQSGQRGRIVPKSGVYVPSKGVEISVTWFGTSSTTKELLVEV